MSNDAAIKVRQAGDTVLAHFVNTRILDDKSSVAASQLLQEVTDKLSCQKIILNFAGVEYLSSAFFGKLITLYKQLSGRNIRFQLVNISPQIFEVFTITKLDKILEFGEFDEDAEASDFEDGAAGVVSWLIPLKPSGSGAVKLPFPRSESE